jgi:hypothetical protein
MDFTKFLQSLVDAKNKFLADCNAAIKPLPPIEQTEAASIASYAVRELNSAVQWMTNVCMQFDAQTKDLIERGQQILADYNKAQVDAAIAAGDLIPKAKIEAGDYLSKETATANCNAAALAAANAREVEVVERLNLLASRRSELYTPTVGADGKEVPALLSREIVEKLPDELLKGDDYLANIKIITGRVGEVLALKVNVPQLLARAYELSLDDAGTAQFTEQLSMIKSAVGESKTKPGDKPPVTSPFARGVEAASQSELIAL